MQRLKQSRKRATELYWLAFLLTGHIDLSIDVAIDSFDIQDGASPLFPAWMLQRSRRLVISKALAAIGDELVASARRTESKRSKKPELPPRGWALDHDTTKAVLEHALLAIDVFPRCALLLSIFEGVSMHDAVILLGSDQNLVRKALVTGLRELTGNLARNEELRTRHRLVS
jgi:hypothetical protein